MKHIVRGLLVVVAFAACSRASEPVPSAKQPARTEPVAVGPVMPAGFTRVTDPSQVCMVNNQFMGKPQIPIEVEGRTYFGCCAMCKDRLNNDPASRVARDPVTNEEVDKAKAVIVQDSSGKVLYFTNEDTLGRYRG